MKQPRINGRQARWLVYLTPYDFIIRHRPGLLNPADGPSRRPDYMATAQKESGQIHKDLLSKKLVGPDSYLPEAEEPHDTARFQLCEAARVIPVFKLSDSARPRPERPDRSEHLPEAEEPHDTARCQLCEVARVIPDFE